MRGSVGHGPAFVAVGNHDRAAGFGERQTVVPRAARAAAGVAGDDGEGAARGRARFHLGRHRAIVRVHQRPVRTEQPEGGNQGTRRVGLAHPDNDGLAGIDRDGPIVGGSRRRNDARLGGAIDQRVLAVNGRSNEHRQSNGQPECPEYTAFSAPRRGRSAAASFAGMVAGNRGARSLIPVREFQFE